MTMALDQKVALITGANQGLGLEIAQHYVQAGAKVFLCARNQAMLEEARISLLKLPNTEGRVASLACDISVESDVTKVVEQTIKQFGRIDILVNNAGVYGPKGAIEDVDWVQWVSAIQINLMGSVLMSRAVLPHFKRQKKGKIIQLSGGGATNPLPFISAYAVSKAAIIRYCETLAEEVREFQIDVNAIAPGPLNTRMLDEVLQAGPEKVGATFYQKAIKQKEQGGAPLNKGAELAVFLGSQQSDGITGKLISAVWDDWENFPSHKEQLKSSDVYTLRRIVAKDRGFQWGDK
ncbi:MAG: SDR family NAD(P)-dependent oxidoreductase [Pseudobdellovibrionaceae bacterium]